MKAKIPLILGLFVLTQLATVSPAASRSEIVCGQTIMEDTIIQADLTCPADTVAITIGASNITLDLGGHTVFGQYPGIGVFADGVGGITIKNGALEGHNDAVFLFNTHNVTVEYLQVRQLTDSDINHLIRGIVVVSSQRVAVRDSFFEYYPEFHREAVEVYESDVIVSDIEVRSGGAGVNFAFAGSCDPVNRPSNGVVRNSRFVDLRHGVLVACSSSTRISGNVISPEVWMGITAEGASPGDVTGVVFEGNVVSSLYRGVELGGTSNVTVSHNIIRDGYQGIALVPSMGCTTPETGEECYYPTGITVTYNQVFSNTLDLYHDPNIHGNVWERNTCETKEGNEIPACLPLTAALFTNFPSGKPGSFFTVEGANFPAESDATITINGTLLGTIPTDASGELLFLLDTEHAGAGFYTVTVSTADVSSSARFILSSRNLRHDQEDEGTIFEVPSGIGVGVLYLPFTVR